MSNNLNTQPINPRNRANQIGLVITRGGVVTPDVAFSFGGDFGTITGEFSKLIHVGTAGNLYVRNSDGVTIPFIGLSDDSWIPVQADMVLSSGTTATNITWYGGI